MQDIQEEPTWTYGMTFPEYGPLRKDSKTDVLIIGAGITGITSAPGKIFMIPKPSPIASKSF